MSEEENTYEVERIISHRVCKDKVQYLVHWLGYNSDEDTWECEENLKIGSTELLNNYKAESLKNENKKALKGGPYENSLVKNGRPVKIIKETMFGGICHIRVQLKDDTYVTYSKKFVKDNFPKLK